MIDVYEQNLLQNCIEDLKKLEVSYEGEKEDIPFFISEDTTKSYNNYLLIMEEKTNELLRYLQSW